METLNTKESEFKIITDQKDEPDTRKYLRVCRGIW